MNVLCDKTIVMRMLIVQTLQTTLIVAVNMVTKEMAPPVCVSLILLYTALVVYWLACSPRVKYIIGGVMVSILSQSEVHH